MSSTLTIEPCYRKLKELSPELKFALRRGNKEESINNLKMDSNSICYLKGLYDAGIDDAKVVIEFIEKYDVVVLNEVY